jgi:hypothetical protein
MAKRYRIVFESYNEEENIAASQIVVLEGTVEKPSGIDNLGFFHQAQIHLLKTCQDQLLKEQLCLLDGETHHCPSCDIKLSKAGKNRSSYHDVFTDHEVQIGRKRCPTCKYERGSTIKNLFGDPRSIDLIKLQTELGSEHSYRDSQKILSQFCGMEREINNHERVKRTCDAVGAEVGAIREFEQEAISIKPAAELVLNVDGGHINTVEEDKRSFEAMISVVYRPESLIAGERPYLKSKHCAASAINDNQQSMIANTIIAALKEGLTPQTKITALCDGAANCWKIVTALEPLCAEITCILDWFHISMKIQNLSIPKSLGAKLESVKWLIWHGKTIEALAELSALIEVCSEEKRNRLIKLKNYIQNNSDKIVNYDERKRQGLVFTSHLAECTVESLINQRCKGQQHMRWSREGLEPVLQLRAAIASDDWNRIWKTAVINSILPQ